MHFLALFHTAIPIQPPPLRGTSFQRKEGASTRAPSLGRGCRAQRGGVGFLFCGEAASSLPSPLGKGDRAAVDRVLSYIAYLRRSPSLSFMPPVPYPPLRGTFPSRGRQCVGDTAFPLQPPPLRGTSFRRKEGEAVKNHLPPSQGRGMPEGQRVGRRRKSEANLRRYAPPPSRGRRESRVTAPKPFLRRKETMREYRFPRTVISSESGNLFRLR